MRWMKAGVAEGILTRRALGGGEVRGGPERRDGRQPAAAAAAGGGSAADSRDVGGRPEWRWPALRSQQCCGRAGVRVALRLRYRRLSRSSATCCPASRLPLLQRHSQILSPPGSRASVPPPPPPPSSSSLAPSLRACGVWCGSGGGGQRWRAGFRSRGRCSRREPRGRGRGGAGGGLGGKGAGQVTTGAAAMARGG